MGGRGSVRPRRSSGWWPCVGRGRRLIASECAVLAGSFQDRRVQGATRIAPICLDCPGRRADWSRGDQANGSWFSQVFSGSLPVHPHQIVGAHNLTSVDKDGGAFIDVVADLDVGMANHAQACSRFIAAHVVDKAFVVQVGRTSSKEHIGRALLALIHLVDDGVRHWNAFRVGRQAYVRQDRYDYELGVFGGSGFVGHE